LGLVGHGSYSDIGVWLGAFWSGRVRYGAVGFIFKQLGVDWSGGVRFGVARFILRSGRVGSGLVWQGSYSDSEAWLGVLRLGLVRFG